jgi:hypothetical protein
LHGYWSVLTRVNAIRVGELELVGSAADTFTEVELVVMKNSPSRFTIFTSLTDACISYLHTAESPPQGGFAEHVAPVTYRYSSRQSAVAQRSRSTKQRVC